MLVFGFQARKCTVCSMMGLLNVDNKVVRDGGVGFFGRWVTAEPPLVEKPFGLG